MLTSDVMTWSPSGKGEVTLSRTVAQWIPSEEYQSAADNPVPVVSDPPANTPAGVDKMSLTTAPEDWLTTLSAPLKSCQCWASVEYHMLALPPTVPAANRPSAPAVTVSITAPPPPEETPVAGASKAGVSGTGRKGWPGRAETQTAAFVVPPVVTDPTTI